MNEEQRDSGARGDTSEKPEVGMKELTEKLEDMAEEQRDRLPERGTADQAGELPQDEADRLTAS